MLMFCGSRSAAGCPVLPPPFLFSPFLVGWGCAGGGGPSCAARRSRAFVIGRVRVVACLVCRDCELVCVFVCVRCYERSVDALASGADEGRGGLRYSSGSRLAGCDPRVSEWGDPARVMSCHLHLNCIGCGG